MNNAENANQEKYQAGLGLLRRPLLPLVSMLRFFMLTGDFSRVEDVIAELPAPIETAQTCYQQPAEILQPFADILSLLNADAPLPPLILEQGGEVLDPVAAKGAWVMQQVVRRELESINSLLCAPCHCRLCCTGPDARMQQAFFEIPLQDNETAAFDCMQIDSPESRAARAMDEDELLLPPDGRPFYQQNDAALIHWKNGWSLILPRESLCPRLEAETGRCQIYAKRPNVCRRPQIFPYVIEVLPAERDSPAFRVRNALLAVSDCPYVRDLQDEIASFAAASELELILTQNKA